MKRSRFGRVGVLAGGPSNERDISLRSGKAVHDALLCEGIDAIFLDVKDNIRDIIEKSAIDMAFIALHGRFGEDGTVQKMLENARIPYTGSGVFASAAAMDKKASKRLFDAAKLPTAPWYVLNKPRSLTRDEMSKPPPDCGGHPKGGLGSRLGYPVVVKPASQGSAVGVSIVKRAKDWPAALMILKYAARRVPKLIWCQDHR